MKKIYDTIETEQAEIKTEPYTSLPDDLSAYKIAYVGKHKAIQPNSGNKDLTEKDMDPNLLIECRLFNENENEEIYIFPRKGKLRQRTIKLKSGEEKYYIEKKIQLRNPQGSSGTTNDTLIVHHYIKQDGGYDFMRYVKIEEIKNNR